MRSPAVLSCTKTRIIEPKSKQCYATRLTEGLCEISYEGYLGVLSSLCDCILTPGQSFPLRKLELCIVHHLSGCSIVWNSLLFVTIKNHTEISHNQPIEKHKVRR